MQLNKLVTKKLLTANIIVPHFSHTNKGFFTF